MFKLTHEELGRARDAINNHGYSTLLPDPPEWETLEEHWDSICPHLADIDLDTYAPHAVLKVFVPKDPANLRVVHLLHPEDLLIYTALTLIIKDDIESARIASRSRRVFSYRVDRRSAATLYSSTAGSYQSYLAELQRKVSKSGISHVAVADIADFYARIYQHRLENILQTVASTDRASQIPRVLAKKLISNIMGRNSYGIPIGPYASRVLAEAVLIDVDSHLASKRVDFVRWVDDFNIFARSEAEAQRHVYDLGAWLYEQHGLTLQGWKTKILAKQEFVHQVLREPGAELTDRDQVIVHLRQISDYDDEDEEELDEEEIAHVLEVFQSVDLREMLNSAIVDPSHVDYQIVGFVLRKLPRLHSAPAELIREVLEFVTENVQLLVPVAEQVGRFIASVDILSAPERRRVAKALLKPLKSGKLPPQDYHAMWILDVFAKDSAWNHRTDLVAIYLESQSEVVRRYAALAIAECGSRSQALSIRDGFETASTAHRMAILRASRLLGNDERKHWKLTLTLDSILETKI